MIRDRGDGLLPGIRRNGPEDTLARVRQLVDGTQAGEDNGQHTTEEKLALIGEAVRAKEELAIRAIDSLNASLKKELSETSRRLRKLEGRLSLPVPQKRVRPPTVSEVRIEMAMLRLAAEKTKAEVELFRKKLEERI